MRSAQRRSTGTTVLNSATASQSRWCRPGIGRRADCSTATRRCGRVLCWRRRRARYTSSAIPATATASISFGAATRTGKIYIVGDAGYADGQHFRRVAQAHGPLRLAILPIGAYEPRWFMRDQHMNPSDAVKALADSGAEQALAHHHGTFQLTDEAIDAPATALEHDAFRFGHSLNFENSWRIRRV